MSITFAPEMAPIIGFRLTDHLGGRSSLIADHAEAVAQLAALNASGEVLQGCTDAESARYYGAGIEAVTADGDDAPEVNMSNTNAVTLLGLLGLDTEGFGDCPADDFLGRVLVAAALSPADEGVPAHTTGGAPRMVECGRRSGYIQGRLGDLHRLATWAVAHDRAVQWG
ncbi:hypothetical protein GS489_00960 [Rhodococcus hoagii]|nr:hypothetical protein [Prescottella equi]